MDILTSWILGLLVPFVFTALPEGKTPEPVGVYYHEVPHSGIKPNITARLCMYSPSNSGQLPPLPFTATLTDTLLLPDQGLSGASAGDIIEYTLTISLGSAPPSATGIIATLFLDENTSYKTNSLKSSVVALDDEYPVTGNMSMSVPAAEGILKNDINLDSDALSITMLDNSTLQGTVSLLSDGSFTFTPAAGFRGQTHFTYRVSDGTFTSTGKVTFVISQMVWFIKGGSASPGTGHIGSPFSSIANFVSQANDMAGDKIFLYSGNYSNGLTLLDRQWLVGQGTTSSSFYTACGLPSPSFPLASGHLLPTVNGTAPVISSSSSTLTAAKKNRITGVTVSGSGGTGFSAASFDSLYVRQVSVTNSSGPALDIATGFLDAEFIRINSTGGTFGMRISTTTGSCKVTGSSNTDNSGGIIQGFTQRGIDIQNARSIQLRNIKLESNSITANQASCTENANTSCYAALHASGVQGLSLHNIDIPSCSATGFNLNQIKNLTIDTCTLSQTGNSYFENCMTATQLSGTCTIKQTSFSKPASKAFHLYRSTNDTLQLSIQNSSFLDAYASVYGQDLFECTSQNNGLTVIQLSGCRFKKAKTKALQMLADDASTIQFSMTDCSVLSDTIDMAGIDISAVGSAKIRYNLIQNDTIQSRGEVAILSYAGGSATMEGRINQNSFIQKSADSTDVFSAVRILQEEGGWGKIEALNNPNLQLVNGEAALQGISRAAATGAGRLDLTTVGNTIVTDVNSLEGIEMRTGASLTGTENNTGCIRAASNQITAGSLRAFRSRQVNPTSQLLLQGSGTTISSYWAANSNTNTGGAIEGAGTLTFGATCLLPTHTSLLATDSWLTSTDKEIRETLPAGATHTIETGAYTEPPLAEASAASFRPVSGQQLVVGGSGFTLPANKNITIKWQAVINNTLPAGVCNIASQASITSSGFSTLLSDDPDSAASSDSTFTDLVQPASITCPASVQVAITNSNCTSSQSFSANASGCPAASLSYAINQQAVTFPYAFPPGQTLVTVTATNSLPSTASCTFTVTVDALHAAYEVSGSDTLCNNGSGASITLTDSDSGISYQLFKNGVATGTSKPGTGAGLSFTNITESGVYKIKGVSPSGCTVTMNDSARVLLVSPPYAGTDADTILCGTSSTLLTASAANGTGMWSVRSGPSLSAGQFASIASASSQFTATGGTGVYENAWVVSNGSCPNDTALFVVTLKDVPVANAGNDTTLCLGETIPLRASSQHGAGSWQVVSAPANATPIVSNAQLNNAVFSSDTTGVHSLSWNVSESGCPTKRDTVTLTVFLNPASFLTPNQTICSGMPLMPILATSATATFAYQWSRDNLQNISGVSPSGQDSIPGKLVNLTNTSQSVTFSLTGGQCRIREFSGTVIVHPAPVVTFAYSESSGLTAHDGKICAADSIHISVSGASAYLWGGGETTPLIRKNPSVSTTYPVRTTSIDGCIGNDSVMVTVFQNPDGSLQVVDSSGLTPNDAIVCASDSLTLVASSGYIYLWSDASTNNRITFVPTTSDLITVIMTDANGCTDTDSVQVQVNQRPDILVSVTENSVIPNDGILCDGGMAIVAATGALTYSWSTGETGDQINVQPTSSLTYKVTGTDALGCSDEGTAQVNIKTLPDAGVTGPEGMTCAGLGGQLIASGGTSYSWSDGQTGAAIIVNPARTTVYTVTITDSDGCTGSASFTYEVDLCCQKPSIQITTIVQPTCQQGGSVTFSDLPNGTWTLFQQGVVRKIYSSSGNMFTATDIPEGVYRFSVSDENGCASLLTPAFAAILVTH